MKKFVNLMHHPVKILQKDGSVKEIPPSGQIARADFELKEIDRVDGIPIVKAEYKNIMGLPEPQKDTYFIVSSIVKNAVGESRPDVVAPFDVHRVEGKPLFCKGFRING